MPRKKKTEPLKDGVIVSSLPMLAACPKFESGEAGEAANFGSLFHEAVEKRDPAKLETEEALGLSSAMNWTKTEVDAAYEWATMLEDALISKYAPAVCDREVVGELSLIPGRKMKMDLLMIMSDGGELSSAIVLDWKTGRKSYEADTNEQGWGYVVSMFEALPSLKEVSMVFASPFIQWYDWHTYSRDQLPELRKTLKAIVDDARSDKSVARVCDYCSWCSKRETCGAVSAGLEEVVAYGVGFDPPVPSKPFENLSLAEARKDPEKMSYLRDLVPFLEKMITAIKQAADEMRFEDGVEIPGYRVAHRKSSRRVVSGEERSILLRVSEKFGLDVRELLPYVKIDVKSLEQAVSDSVKAGGKAEQVQAFMEECLASGWVTGGDDEGSPYLVKSKRTQTTGA